MPSGFTASATPLAMAEGGPDGAALAHAFVAARRQRRGRLEMPERERRQIRRRRQRVVHEAAGEDLARVVVDDPLGESLADALGDRAVNLSLDDHRVDDG